MTADANACIDAVEEKPGLRGHRTETTDPESGSQRGNSPQLDPGLVRIYRNPGTMIIRLLPAPHHDPYTAVLDGLQPFIDQHAQQRQWTLDVSELPQLGLPLLDALLRVGKQIRARGGCVVFSGVRAEAVVGPFAELFLQRCREESIRVTSDEPACIGDRNPNATPNEDSGLQAQTS